METLRQIDSISTINAGSGEPGALVVRHAAVTDPRLTLADLGLYVRCLWLHDVRGEHGEVDWLIGKLDMPPEETRAGLRRLVRAGYLSIPSPEKVEARRTLRQVEGVRAALDQAGMLLSDYERAVVTRFVRLAEERAERAARTASLFAQAGADDRTYAVDTAVRPTPF
jgi:hypothetical protein